MLKKHLRNNGVLVSQMDSIQQEAHAEVLEKIADGTYGFEAVDCPTCQTQKFTPLAERDRYGIPCRLVTCETCGLFQVSPRFDAGAFRDFYENRYRRLYHGGIVPDAAHSPSARERGRVALDLLSNDRALMPGAHVVEIGCASGGQLLPFQTANCRVSGYDHDHRIAALGRSEHGLDLNPGGLVDYTAAVEAGTALKADAVLYIHVFEHLLDLRAELAALEQVLTPDGRLYLEVPGLSRCLRTREHFFDNYFEVAHTYHFDRETLTALVESCGWTCLWSDNFVRAVLTPERDDASYTARTLETIEQAETARILQEDVEDDTDPDALLQAWLNGGVTHAQAYYAVGEMLFARKDPACVDALQRASALDPERGKYSFMLARALMEHSDEPIQAHLDVLERAAHQMPQMPYPQFHYGRALYALGRIDEAIGAFAVAIRTKPDIPLFNYWQGLAYKRTQNPARAAEFFRTALNLDDQMHTSYYELGLCLDVLGKHEDAVAAFETAYALKPSDLFADALSKAQAAVDTA